MSSLLWDYPVKDPLETIDPELLKAPLSEDKNADGKSLVNPQRSDKSAWYNGYPDVIDESNNAFDFHIYYNKGPQMEHARKLYDRIRREFPELRVYKFWDIPVGPHPVPMFEVNTFTPQQFGALFGFLVAYRAGLSVLIHPNTDDAFRDHTDRATWMGERYPLVAMPGLQRAHHVAAAARLANSSTNPPSAPTH
ncbi:hypothetical protein T439DRAFT_322793 [Meredithblackwellia eburnea MCA 4105]